jgi:hypothetical protein
MAVKAAGDVYGLDWCAYEKTQPWKCHVGEAAFAGRDLEQSAHDDRLRRVDTGHCVSCNPDCQRLVRHPAISRLFTSAG